ncbi:MAG: pilus assembly protein PilM [Patescibacteria group bacterium]
MASANDYKQPKNRLHALSSFFASFFQKAVEGVPTLASRTLRDSVLGVDIGTSSIKIVQLSHEKGSPKLDTYGAIELAPYKTPDVSVSASVSLAEANALADLMHEVNATAREGGCSIPLSSTLFSISDIPKRDDEQTRVLIAHDAQKFIPVPIQQVALDWKVIPEREAGIEGFDRLDETNNVRAHMQKVLIVAVIKEAINARAKIFAQANLSIIFNEIEMFGAMRVFRDHIAEPTLIIDIGASKSKFYTVNEKNSLCAVNSIDIGGDAIVEALTQKMHWSMKDSEEALRKRGMRESKEFSSEANDDMADIFTNAMHEICKNALRLMDEFKTEYARSITKIILVGGCARMNGLPEYISESCSVTTERGDSFKSITTPFVLADSIRDAGPQFAVATGLALRGLESR